MSGVPDNDNMERRRSERLGNKRPRGDDIYLEEGKQGQLTRKTAKSLIRNTKQRQSPSQGTAEESDGFVQDQIIVAPEIMEKILSHLDLRTMKQVRLVCKSWLLEAQPHLKKRGIVCLERTGLAFPRLWDFTDTIENKHKALPQPFMSLDLNLGLTYSYRWVPNERMFRQLSSLICPPLEIRKFFTAGLPLKLILPLLTQCSFSLEHLDFFANHSEIQDLIPWMEQDLNFPKLRHLFVHTSSGIASYSGDWIGFPATVARIMKASPNLDAYSIWCVDFTPGGQQLANEIMLGVDITNVKTLQLKDLHLSNVASQLIAAMPFNQLQNLKILITGCYDSSPWDKLAMIGIAKTAAWTLRKLELLDIEERDLLYLPGSAFPVCPNVQELHMSLFDGWIEFVSRCFPTLQVFTTSTILLPDVSDEDHVHGGVSPFHNVKAIILVDEYRWNLGPMELFSLFPQLERLNVYEGFFYKYYGMETTVSRKCSVLVKGLKHLYLRPSHPENLFPSPLLAQLKGLETITLMASNRTIARLPLKELPRLKVIRFNWGDCLAMKKLLEIARQVKTVVITNCCSVPTLQGNRKLMARLEEYFAAAPNVECGCKKETEILY